MRLLLAGLATLFTLALGCSATESGASDAAKTVSDSGVDAQQSSMDAARPDTRLSVDASSDSADALADVGQPHADVGPGPTYRNSLSVCWTDVNCNRAFAIAHGGDWDVANAPYDSNAAIAAAYTAGYDGVKIDVRITKDGVPVIAHSSPIEGFESLDCKGDRIEEMTADEVTACHRFPSTTETFQRLNDVLEYLRGKMVAQLTVKLSSDLEASIADVLAVNAQDFVFFEVDPSALQNVIPTVQGADQVYYVVDLGSDLSQVDALLNDVANPRAFIYESDPSTADSIADLVATKLHPAGVRAFTYDKDLSASVATLQTLYDKGFDIVSSQHKENGVTARINVNKSRGISPP